MCAGIGSREPRLARGGGHWEALRNFPERSYDRVDILVRNVDGARECGEILQSLAAI